LVVTDLVPCHIGVRVPDINASLEWYEEMLGFKFVKQSALTLPGSETVTRMAWIKNGNFYIEFFEDTESPPFNMETYRHSIGVKHISFIVPNFNELVAHLKQKGVKFIVDGHWACNDRPADEGSYVAYILDNSGIPIELQSEFDETGRESYFVPSK
jgi:catechol 2,3-dioxygenase-like lactoylglutathione lyase family enzyme